MSLKEQVATAMKEAMKAKDKERLTAIRSIKSAILLKETESGAAQDLNQEQEIDMLMKMAKQRKDSIQTYNEQGRDDLKVKEEAELKVIEEFLPAQLSDEELSSAIKTIVSETGASGMKDMGKVMGVASQKLAGQADGKRISALVKSLLA